MTGNQFHRDNHFVPCTYLKNWASCPDRVWTYPVLVSHERVPIWKERYIKGIAYHSHLYTGLIAGSQTDEIERWLGKEFEDPVAEALNKAVSDDRLTPDDWRKLIQFLAAQDVRTPARLFENMVRWQADMPDFLDETLNEAVEALTSDKRAGKRAPVAHVPQAEHFPFRVRTKNDGEFAQIGVETVVGRGLWLFIIKHLLTNTSHVLNTHRWTIVSPSKGESWFTSDDPVIRLNFYSAQKYDFLGGWAKQGTEIMLPLGPQHLLYTKVGAAPPRRGSRMSPMETAIIKKMIAEHAHRMIFASEQLTDMDKLRPRVVSAVDIKSEKEQWKKWHEEQIQAENDLQNDQIYTGASRQTG